MLVRIIGGHGGLAPGFRNTSYLIDGKLLIDAGSVASGLRIEEQNQIDNILISHSHLDHISDLAFLCDNCFGMKSAPFYVYSSPTVRHSILAHLMNDVIWPDFTRIPSKKNPTMQFSDLKNEQILQLGEYKIMPVKVNHPGEAMGFIVERTDKDVSVLFTQDTGPTDRIWEIAKSYKNLKAIFTEVSFPNSLAQVAADSCHHTSKTMEGEILKMPKDIPIFLGHLKPNYQAQLFQEISQLNNERITVLSSDDTSYVFT